MAGRIWLKCRSAERRILSSIKWFDTRPMLLIVVLSFIINFILEVLGRHSIADGFIHLLTNPLIFIVNALIALVTFLPVLFIKRRTFVLMLVSIIWLGLGITNCVLLMFGTTPLSASHIALMPSVFSIISVYLEVWQIVLTCILIVILVAFLVVCWLRTEKKKIIIKRSLIEASAVIALLTIFLIFVSKVERTSEDFGNLISANKSFGFAYCFTLSIFDRGIDEPEEYSEVTVDSILKAIKAEKTVIPKQKPNIIMVQLESFFDLSTLEGISFSENPMPVFSELKEECSSGYLSVPSVGAGTAQTEFEILTGMCLDSFGAGEYPYKTVLQSTTCESFCFNLKELGYKCHAVHNHTGTFYDRNIVYSDLGFDTFTSLEYMNDVKYNALGWAKDKILSTEIFKALRSTKGQDLVYAISVQAHGKYSSDVVDEDQHITVNGIDDPDEKAAFEYYVSQIHQTDAFIGALVSTLDYFDEPVVVVLFGDHLPSLNIDAEDISNGDVFQTEYVVWSNCGLVKGDRDLSAFQLTAYIQKRLGMNSGILTKLHQSYYADDEYMQALEMLEYDMLYGEKNVYDGVNPYIASDLQMGVMKIEITKVKAAGGSTYVLGSGFTEWSQVFINDKKADTIYIDSKTLLVADELVEPGAVVTVGQVSGDNYILSVTDGYVM